MRQTSSKNMNLFSIAGTIFLLLLAPNRPIQAATAVTSPPFASATRN